MRPDDINEWLWQVPFQPFRLYVLETTTYEVHHPEMVITNRSTLDLFFTAAHPCRPVAERQITIALAAHHAALANLAR